jgi:5-methylcytosine-specific restriction protein A
VPHSALRPCTWPGCNTLVSAGRCELHSSKKVERDPATKKLYDSRQWKSIRRRQLAEYPWCVDCLAEGKHVPATEVDHIEPHHGDVEKFFAGPLQSLCTSHHSRKTANEVWHTEVTEV